MHDCCRLNCPPDWIFQESFRVRSGSYETLSNASRCACVQVRVPLRCLLRPVRSEKVPARLYRRQPSVMGKSTSYTFVQPFHVRTCSAKININGKKTENWRFSVQLDCRILGRICRLNLVMMRKRLMSRNYIKINPQRNSQYSPKNCNEILIKKKWIRCVYSCNNARLIERITCLMK